MSLAHQNSCFLWARTSTVRYAAAHDIDMIHFHPSYSVPAIFSCAYSHMVLLPETFYGRGSRYRYSNLQPNTSGTLSLTCLYYSRNSPICIERMDCFSHGMSFQLQHKILRTQGVSNSRSRYSTFDLAFNCKLDRNSPGISSCEDTSSSVCRVNPTHYSTVQMIALLDLIFGPMSVIAWNLLRSAAFTDSVCLQR